MAADVVALMTPVVKATLTDHGVLCANLALQVHGGHGYIVETGVEQLVRDARITQVYEGTNGVQALDLVGRKLPEGAGRMLRRLCHPAAAWVEENRRHPELGELAEPLGAALGRLQRTTLWLGGRALADREEAGAAATEYLRLLALHDVRLPLGAHGGGGPGHQHGNAGGAAAVEGRAGPLLHGARPARDLGAGAPDHGRQGDRDAPGGRAALTRRPVLLLPALCLALVLAAYGGDDGGSSAPTSAAAPPTTAPATTTPPSTAAAPTTTAPPASTTGAGTARCGIGDLEASLAPQSPGAGQRYAVLVLTNDGSAPCHTKGYPGLGLETADGKTLPSEVQWGGPGEPAPEALTLAPGESASALLHWGAVPARASP